MKSLFYAMVLLAVVAGSLILLHSLETPPVADGPGLLPPRVEYAENFESLEPPGVPAVADTMSVEQLLAAGERLLRSWRPREATRMFERLVAVDSTHYQGWVRLVECYSDPLVGREDSARDAWRHARRSMPGERDSTVIDGLRDLFLESDYLAAAGSFAAAQHAADVDFYLARSNYLAGRLEDAQAQVERMVAADPRDGRAADLLVRVMVARGDLDRAARLGRDLAREHAAEPFPYVLIARVEMLRGEESTAVEFCNSALMLDARCIPAIVTRATLYAKSGQAEAARVSFEKLLLYDDPILRGIGQAGIAFVDFHTGEFGRGMEAMDAAIRHAVMAGAVRRGLSYASTLVGYLCELGQVDRAQEVVDRWIRGFGDVPVQLGSLRIQILRGDLAAARRTLAQTDAGGDYRVWARVLALDPIELAALIDVAAGDHAGARARIAAADSVASVGAGVRARRTFMRAYAAFEGGDAETAAASFTAVPYDLYGMEFPGYGDPVLDVQSLFYIGEAAIASGAEAEARAAYASFLGRWGDAAWDLPAVARAREKLASLGESAE